MVKEKLEDALLAVRQAALREIRAPSKGSPDVKSQSFFQKQLERQVASLGAKVASFLSSGNLVSSTGVAPLHPAPPCALTFLRPFTGSQGWT